MYHVLTRVTRYDGRDGICGYRNFPVGQAETYAEAVAIRDREIESIGGCYSDCDVVVVDENGRECHTEPFCGPLYVLSGDEVPF